jgi:pimeloyl-ACP methyl ester carboxylesterase
MVVADGLVGFAGRTRECCTTGVIMIHEVQTTTVTAADGRELCVEIAGGGAARSVLVHNGTPNSRHLFGQWIEDAASRDVRLISYDRPGYGSSTASPGRSVADGASDVRAIAGALGIERLAVWGWSGGGPYGLACAALLPDLVVAAAILASPAPWGAPGLDFFAGMGKDNVDEIELYFADPEASRKKGQQEWEQFAHMTIDQLIPGLQTLLSATDAAVLTGELAEWMVSCQRGGLAPGDQGWWDDCVAQLAPWGFELDSISVPVKVWHGREDRFVPFQHGKWLADHVPGADSAQTDTDGHLTLVTERIGDVHDWLIGRL